MKIDETQLCHVIEENYTLRVKAFLPMEHGEDHQALRYRLQDHNDQLYFVKVLKETQISRLKLTQYLHDILGDCVISPIKNYTGQQVTKFRDYSVTLYPFIEGKNGFEQPFDCQDMREIGRIIRKIHSLDSEYLRDKIGVEYYPYVSKYRESMSTRLGNLELEDSRDPIIQELRAFIRTKSELLMDILTILDALDESNIIDDQKMVLCHTDIHVGNILKSSKGELHIIDWDQASIGYKELDLLFFGGGIARNLESEVETHCFYNGYGECEVDERKLAFYRFSRIIEDIELFALEIENITIESTHRNTALSYLKSNFLPGGTIECAYKTFRNLK